MRLDSLVSLNEMTCPLQ